MIFITHKGHRELQQRHQSFIIAPNFDACFRYTSKHPNGNICNIGNIRPITKQHCLRISEKSDILWEYRKLDLYWDRQLVPDVDALTAL